MSALVSGAGGMLGSAFVDALPGAAPLPRDVLGSESLEEQLRLRRAQGFDVLVNCAAHTDVEAAETHLEVDRAANAELPKRLAKACAKAGLLLVHFSSTGCYGDHQDGPYTEDDPARPTTAHHRNKREGELAIAESGVEHLVLRTGWLYGGPPGGAKNFVWKRLIEARRTSEMSSDAVQHGCPTHVDDLVRQVRRLLPSSQRGLFNVVANGSASRYEYVRHIVESARLDCDVRPGPAFRRIAPVSRNETASNQRLIAAGLDVMPEWRTALSSYVRQLVASPEWHA